ncbi:MAG: NAD(P)/FAD-dependent oxidoreductase [Bacteroidetes bacterium]|nr:MAG: NAD(P)/FAD-dependent oxidoreductase [Bacteroidota bacterium]
MSISCDTHSDVLLIGGGLAGLSTALHLAQAGLHVRLLEKESYPRHKVCGEYISNEVLPYLNSLGIDPFAAGATRLQRCLLSAESGRSVEAPLPLGGFGLSRYRLDTLLYQAACQAGADIRQAEAVSLALDEQPARVRSRRHGDFTADLLIGSYGKRSRVDKELGRPFIQHKTPYLGVKAHYAGDFPEDLVALYCFPGGYCGVSKVEEGRINICYLAHQRTFRKYQNLDAYARAVLHQNPALAEILNRVEPLFARPLTISQISFAPKGQAHAQLLLAGDAAGMIHPLCGNGMGMAIASAQLLSTYIIEHVRSPNPQHRSLAQAYSRAWQAQFRRRLQFGRLFNALFYRPALFEWAISTLSRAPWALPFFIRQTHGDFLPPNPLNRKTTETC